MAAKKQKKQNREQSPGPGTDKKGFRVLTDEYDLYHLFGVEKKTREEDFARILEESLEDRRQQILLQEKKVSPDGQVPLTLKERIKTYPGPQEELDLHGDTGAKAGEKTEFFVRNARQKGIRTVRIIVGKGHHSQGKAVLPDVVEKKIIQLKRKKWVLDFDWEKKDKRKSGALVVYLNPPG
ncbi:MAG: Smr/MutS family protein [Candidatus Aminicenantes bacterium]|nr:MAG: Smr/MutS family protein [Candidatus Aminicenantes bacterium]